MTVASALTSSADEPPPARLKDVRALALRTFSDARTRTTAFACLFGFYSYIQPVGYRHAYPTVADRAAFAHSFANNDALRLFYGYPYAPRTVTGYSAWRVGGTLAIAAAVFGVFAAVRALRTEEDAGRTEIVLAGCISRASAYLSTVSAIIAGAALLWLAECVGFVAAGLPVSGSAYLALASTSVIPVFAGVGALTSQLAGSRRVALELGVAVIGLALLVRVVADTSSAGWLRWATPLGWAEELRPFSGAHPLVLLLAAAASVLLALAAGRLVVHRDVGSGILAARDSSAPRLGLLSSCTAHALRTERASVIAWLSGVGLFALVLGVVSASVSSAGISKRVREEIARLGSGSIATPTGYLSFVFVFFILAASLFVCAQISAARREESEQQLETVLSLPVSRERWLIGRLLLATGAAAGISLLAGLLTWAGAASQGVGVSLPRMLEAGANCLPVALLFLGIAAFAYALTPRAGVGVAYGLVAAMFLWQLVGSLLGMPKWLVDVTPFAHVGLMPIQPFRAASAVIMLVLAAILAAAAVRLFARRDLAGQ